MHRTDSSQNHVRTHLTVERLECRDCPSVYSIIDLLPPAGSSTSSGLALNDQGLVAGRAPVAGYVRAAVWQTEAGPTASGTHLPVLGTGIASDAYDVNNSGMIAGFSTQVGNDPAHAVVWTGSGGAYVVHDLGTLGGAFVYSEAAALGDPDPGGVTWVVGRSSTGGVTPTTHAVVWRVNAAGDLLSSIDLEPTLSDARASDVRMVDPSPAPGDEYVLVSGYVAEPGNHPAILWKLDLAGNVISRTDLGSLGGSVSWAQGVNSLGHVSGQSRTSTATYRAFLYRDGVMANLGTLTNGHSQATAVNDSDVVVGTCDIFSRSGVLTGSKAFVWQNGTMIDLRSQLGSKDKTNWQYSFAAIDVNATGQIVGSGRVGKGTAAQEHGFLMTPPAIVAGAVGPGTDPAVFTSHQAQPLLHETVRRWRGAGSDTSALPAIDLRIANLPGATLGLASGNTIWLDDNAAGWGWFVDPTPWDDAEFTTPRDQGEQNRMDLLTVLAHEVGHLLGFDHAEPAASATGDVMIDTLATGIRRLPGGTEVNDLSALLEVLVSEPLSKRRQ